MDREGSWQTDIGPDKQTDVQEKVPRGRQVQYRETVRQPRRRIDGQANKPTNIFKCMQLVQARQTDEESCRLIDKQIDRQTNRQRDRQASRQIGRQAWQQSNRQAHAKKYVQTVRQTG